ncbi:MAG: methionyl-tRNA formyltransferase [Chloroflexi bacterium]|jgi:methionyl-tRNA formyltransferase|nr:methionyl-tRNA formyltransferase [Chloroflexota bacterium]
MRIVFFGSPPEAAASLESLIAAGHDIAAVYSQPDRKSGRGRNKTATPVKTFATQNDLPVFTPKGLRNNVEELERLTELKADAFVVVAYGRILPVEILQVPPMGVVNIHPSLLPKYRGPSPVVTAILEGEDTAGVTIMLLDEGMDTGPILAQSTPMWLSGTEKGAALQSALFKEGASMLPNVLKGLQEGSLAPQPQDDSKASVTRLLERSDGEIDWTSPAERIDRMIRAYDPWPGTFTSWNGKGLKVLDAQISSASVYGAGVVVVDEGRVNVGTGTGSIELKKVQLEGRQAVAAADFLRGQPDFDGATLGT